MMTPLASCAAHWVELSAAAAALLVLVKAVKYRDFTETPALLWEDVGWVVLGELAVALLALCGPVGHVVGTLAGTLLFAALWLDAVLFRVFTIELGPGGVGSVILSVLYRELAELAFARRFFAAHRFFATLPLTALLVHAGVPLAPPGAPSVGLALVLGAGLSLTAATSAPARARRQVFAASALLVLAALAGGLAPPLALALAVAGLGTWAGVGLVPSRRAGGPHGVRHFFIERPRPEPPGFQPRPEHAPLLTQAPRPPRPSAAHGLLRGEDVLLFTFESVGQCHLDAVRPGGARAPFLEGLWPRALRSRHHACVSPTTNNAHRALYTSGYGEGPSAGLRALREAGYRTVYLTTARTADYGLREILDAAGFSHVIDREDLETSAGGTPPDQALLTRGLERLAAVLAGHRPFLLHVHATHTHVPYRVAEPERFHRFDMAEDRGRFFNGIEEADWLFGALRDGLRERGLIDEPLVVLSSDHGQAFGALGYQSHGSAVTREELDVPLVMHHPRLPAREVAFSSHFDVLPTVVDLLGLGHDTPVWGESLLHEDRRPELLVWAGHPSRRTTSHYGLLLRGEKLMVDLTLGRCLRMDWEEEHVETVEGAEKAYLEALVSRLMSLRGVT
ncbi:hypothetical protein D187_009575 [Cystobacter fuscus DSM 2262]|uniref:Sulfatase N-terminal domain-containing protein n=1 Tax=Cystobacter fuscus (strain ATCC 25194 / DSM 2262 / NBRC 100088 / M29) TaxID=1242864 RepID=S9Q1C6_CYSF2|nr:sulfatase-like hydrolase/transferase [Cystobacter fuscus]EPX55069.1 hypothetical protein D187_009575 [Cystobacter fuscus DSM 2262]